MSTSLAEAKRILEKALALLPTLTINGIETKASFKAEGQGYLQKNLHQLALCADWLGLQSATKSVKSRYTSYGYKHRVEEWTDANGKHVYISNGAFIAAAVGLGFAYKQVGKSARFNLSNRKNQPVPESMKASPTSYSTLPTRHATEPILPRIWSEPVRSPIV